MIIDNKIVSFDGSESWLSNFANSEIFYQGRTFSTVEHAYHSMKSNNIQWKETCSDYTINPSKIKILSKEIQLVKNWNTLKLEVMWECLILKYRIEEFKNLLLETNNMYIQEGNYWGDRFWGTSLEGEGRNELGKMIMRIRENLKCEPLF